MINQELFDRFSLLHLASGYMAKKLGFGFGITLLGSIVFEVLEVRLKNDYPNMFPNPSQDSSLNMLGDSIAVMAGWYLGG